MTYGKMDLSKARAIQERLDNTSQGNEYNWYKIEVGSHYFRILPPWDSQNIIAMEVYKHFNVPSPENPSDNTILTCIEKTFPSHGVACPLCAAIQEIETKQPDTDLKRMKASYKAYVNAILRKRTDVTGTSIIEVPESTDETIWIVPLSNTMHSAIINYSMDPDVGDITLPDKGFDLKITRTGTSWNDTRYAAMLMPGSKPINADPEKQAKILQNLPALSEIWRFPDEEDMNNIRQSAERLCANFMVAPTNPHQWNDPSTYEEPKVEETHSTEVLEEGMPELPEQTELDIETSVEEKPATVTTAEDAIKVLGIKPLDHPKAVEGIEGAGTPLCFGQHAIVFGKYPEICDQRCAYEFACKAAQEAING